MLNETQILRGGQTSVSYDITDGWEANPGTVFSMHKWKFKAPNMLRMDFKYHQLGNILCPAVKED